MTVKQKNKTKHEQLAFLVIQRNRTCSVWLYHIISFCKNEYLYGIFIVTNEKT